MDLTALQHSAFLQSLGWAIANSLWQAAILWGLFHIINASYKTATSRFRNNSATVFLFSTFTWFMVTFFQKFYSLSQGSSQPLLISETQLEQLSAYINQPDNFINWQQLLTDASAALPYLSLAYLMLLVLFTTRWFGAYRHTSYIRKYGLQKPGVEWRLFTDKAAMHIGIHKKIKIWFSKHVDVPATIGYLKPVILIPVASLNQLSVQQLEAIILHELAHIKRNDYLVNLVISVIEIVLFFNPFVVLLSKVMKRERENCCDDFVIQYQYDRLSYASALLSIEQYRMQQQKFAMGATSNKKQLLVRVRRIMENNPGQKGFNYGQKLFALLMITGVICSIAWLTPADAHKVVTIKKGSTPGSPQVKSRIPTKQPHAKEPQQVADLAKELRKSLSSKEIEELVKFEKKALLGKKVLPEVHKLLAEMPANFAALKPEINKLKVSGPKPFTFKGFTPYTAFHTDKAFFDKTNNSFQFVQGSSAEELFKSLPSMIDIKGLQLDMQKIDKELSAIEWKKMENEIRLCFENMQKDINNLPAEIKKNNPTFRQLMKTEITKAQNELEKLRSSYQRVQGERLNRATGMTPKMLLAMKDTMDMRSLVRTKINENIYYADATQPVVYDKMITAPGSGGTQFKPTLSPPVTSWSYNSDDEDADVVVKDEKPAKTEKSPCQAAKQAKMNIEFKDGFLIIDGDKIKIQELKDQPALKLKNKHIRVITKNNDQIEVRIGT